MKSMVKIGLVGGLATVLSLAGCANMNEAPSAAYNGVANTRADSIRPGYGVVESIELVQEENSGIGGSGIGVGAVAGAVVGGIVGNQVGSGRGNTAATIAGAAGGAYVGHELEKRQRQSTAMHKITVRMNNGSYQSLLQDTNSGLRAGDRVRIEDGVIRREY